MILPPNKTGLLSMSLHVVFSAPVLFSPISFPDTRKPKCLPASVARASTTPPRVSLGCRTLATGGAHSFCSVTDDGLAGATVLPQLKKDPLSAWKHFARHNSEKFSTNIHHHKKGFSQMHFFLCFLGSFLWLANYRLCRACQRETSAPPSVFSCSEHVPIFFPTTLSTQLSACSSLDSKPCTLCVSPCGSRFDCCVNYFNVYKVRNLFIINELRKMLLMYINSIVSHSVAQITLFSSQRDSH